MNIWKHKAGIIALIAIAGAMSLALTGCNPDPEEDKEKSLVITITVPDGDEAVLTFAIKKEGCIYQTGDAISFMGLPVPNLTFSTEYKSDGIGRWNWTTSYGGDPDAGDDNTFYSYSVPVSEENHLTAGQTYTIMITATFAITGGGSDPDAGKIIVAKK